MVVKRIYSTPKDLTEACSSELVKIVGFFLSIEGLVVGFFLFIEGLVVFLIDVLVWFVWLEQII